MKKLVVLMCVLALALPVFAAEKQEGATVSETDCTKDVRPAVNTLFQQGQKEGKSLEQMIRQALELGPNLCGVLVVANELGYPQKDVLNALADAGVANEVIVRAAVDAGYDKRIVGEVVGLDELAGLGYTPAGATGAVVANPTTVGGGGRISTSVSPSKVQ
ncbi:hypothetical protein [Geothermobacter hydrogeniphilus]|uniref:hypothetical protein n=1 Tax=Geothermobacter hydrogeniphilus TaxID=1969733 RepID=UPI001304EDD9|nr:hypothetical protein [Geothermobacter hydrogeniphilus]